MQNLCEFSDIFHLQWTAYCFRLHPTTKEAVIYVKTTCILEEAEIELYYPRQSLYKSLYVFASDTAIDRISKATSNCD